MCYASPAKHALHAFDIYLRYIPARHMLQFYTRLALRDSVTKSCVVHVSVACLSV